MKKLILFIFSALLTNLSVAEDIEIYVGSHSSSIDERHKVLIIFDNSGSMRNTQRVKRAYQNNSCYDTFNCNTSSMGENLYYVKGTGISGGGVPSPAASEKRKFPYIINNCQVAKDRLDEYGFFTGYIKEYTYTGSSGSWEAIPDNNGENIAVIDCWEDVDQENDENVGENSSGANMPNGYPVDGLGTKDAPQYYTSDINDASDSLKAGEVVTLYLDNYVEWYHSDSVGTEDRSRIDIAKDTITTLVATTPSFDFGLQVFNHNHSGENTRDGGRIVHGIQESTPDAQQELINIINLQLDPETNTPLCETYYEAMRYFGGLSVDFGDNDSDRGNSYVGNTPPRDQDIETNSGVYITPFDGCSDDIYVVMITDGAPTRDLAANDEIADLVTDGIDYITGLSDADKVVPGGYDVNGTDNFLPRLAWWARHNDINQNLDGDQKATLFTIGFDLGNGSDEVAMLQEAARQGKGTYQDADDQISLQEALQDIFAEISQRDTTFTAPSVASNNFDRTETLTSVYYAMFSPSKNPRWQGNLKKLEIASGGLVDRNGDPAINDEQNILETADTFWSSVSDDGAKVAEGGVVAMFSSMQPNARVLYSDTGYSNGKSAIGVYSKSNAASAFGSNTELATYMDVPVDDIDSYFNWARGYDVDNDDNDTNGDTSDMRADVFGDPLHSKPLVLNYGGSADDQDVRIIVGTNAGALHMFDDNGNTITEKWAFMPKEFYRNYEPLRTNNSATKVYGIDGTPVSFIYDSDGDGTIEPNEGDKAWVFFGLRRGGSSYYGLDVTYKDQPPKLLWKIDEATPNFGELGQSWSTPTVSYSIANVDSGKAKPVLIFGAGYDANKDASGTGSADTKGRGVYMVDAESGDLIWSITADNSDIVDSVPASIATLDSDSDGYVDRLYFGDTGGFVWRVDMVGDDPDNWATSKLASLGSNTTEADDLRFFTKPTIARAVFTETFEYTEVVNGESQTSIHRTQKPYDAILIGSGDRTSPLSSTRNDKLFMIKDENIITQVFETPPSAISLGELYDYTDNPFEGLVEGSAAYNALALEVSTKKGWYISLLGSKEKALAKPDVLAGVAYYSTFIPTDTGSQCVVDGGKSQIYAVDLALGVKIYNTRIIEHTNTIQDGITLVTVPDTLPGEGEGEGEDDHDRTNKSDGKELKLIIGDTFTLCDGNKNCDGLKLKTMRTHIVVTEDDN